MNTFSSLLLVFRTDSIGGFTYAEIPTWILNVYEVASMRTDEIS